MKFRHLNHIEVSGYTLISQEQPESENEFFFEEGALISTETTQLFLAKLIRHLGRIYQGFKRGGCLKKVHYLQKLSSM